MSTSNWQNISFCIELIRRINPKRVLDVGVGFGRWGILCREFLDVWEGRLTPGEWNTEIVGVEAFKAYIKPYHDIFYSKIINQDAYEYLSKSNEHYDLVVLGDVLEHFEKERGNRVLEICLSRSTYVLLNIPLGRYWPQQSSHGNAFEEHKSTWDKSDFIKYPIMIQKHFKDHLYRPFGVFLFSSSVKAIPHKSYAGRAKSILKVRYPKIVSSLRRLFSAR
jgi:hypothetical protein